MSTLLNQNILSFLQKTTNPVEEKDTYSRRLTDTSSAIKSLGYNLAKGLDAVLVTDVELRNEFNWELKKRNLDGVSYPLLARHLFQAKQIDEETFARAAGTLDTVTNPGGGNFLQTTVSDVIEKRVEDLSLVYNEVSSYDLEQGGNLQIPTYSAFAKTVNTAEGSNLTNLGTTVEGGIGKITLDPQRHGGFIPVFNSFIHKLNGKHLADLLDILAEAFARGRDAAILNANGSGVNILGMNQNATTIPFTGDALTTFKTAAQSVADVQRGGLSGLVAFMSTTAWLEFMELFRDLNNDRSGIIDPVERKIYGVKCVVTDVIESGGATPNKSSTVTLGYGKTYKYGQTQLQTETDKFTNMLTGQTNLYIATYNDGQPSFHNAFAKFNLANIF